MASQEPDLHSGSFGLFPSRAELMVCLHIGSHFCDSIHLNNESQDCTIPFFLGFNKLMDVLNTTLRGSIGEIAYTVPLQGAALHFNKRLLHFATFHFLLGIKVDTGISIGVLWDDDIVTLSLKIFQNHLVWRLAVDVYEQAVILYNSHKIILSLAPWAVRGREIDCTAWDKEFFASAGVLHMNCFCMSINLDLCDETVGPSDKFCLSDIGILHILSLESAQEKPQDQIASGADSSSKGSIGQLGLHMVYVRTVGSCG